MFGRATIRLGIGPHSSFDYFAYFASRKCVVISAVSVPKFSILSGQIEDILVLNKFFSDCRYVP